MSIKVEYFCNLCTDKIEPKDALCLRWNSTIKVGNKFGAYEYTTNLNGSDKHICKSCFKITYDFVEMNKAIFKA